MIKTQQYCRSYGDMDEKNGGEWCKWHEANAECEALEAEVTRLRAALKKVGDDYPGSSCQKWCYLEARLPWDHERDIPHEAVQS